MRTTGLFAAVFSLLISQAATAQQVLPSLADLVERLQPAVVNISTIPDAATEAEAEDEVPGIISTNPVIDNYFKPGQPPRLSLGSGFIIDKTGYIVTNNHVIDGAKEITVTLADNRQFQATVVGNDQKTDLALIKIQTDQELPAVVWGDSDQIRAGDWIIAIGNPFGLGGSVTAGIVSAKSRDIESGPYDNFIQTDASINQGSSGGPMFNLNGEVIGINTAIFSTNGGSMGIGFAVPVNLTKFVINQLKETGKVERGWIGIKIQPNSADISGSLGITNPQGIVVTAVTPGSSGQKAGIRAGDIITDFNSQKIGEPKNFSRMIAETKPGTKISLQILRDKQPRLLEIEVQKMPEDAIGQIRPELPKITASASGHDESIAELGLKVTEVDAEVSNKYNLKSGRNGVVISEVVPGSDAESKGLRPGLLINQIDKKSIFDLNDFQTYLNEAKQENNRPVLLLIYDQDLPHFVAVKMRQP